MKCTAGADGRRGDDEGLRDAERRKKQAVEFGKGGDPSELLDGSLIKRSGD